MRRELLRSTALTVMLAVVLAATAACRQSAEDRARHAGQRARSQVPVRTSEIVEGLRTRTEPGSLIYDTPIDLSDATLRRTRADLLRLDSARAVPSASPAGAARHEPHRRP